MIKTQTVEQRNVKLFRTLGRDFCHWCSLRPQAWVWGPYGTRVCASCQDMVNDGRAAEVVKEIAGRMVVLDTMTRLELEQWRQYHLSQMRRWVNLRTGFQAV